MAEGVYSPEAEAHKEKHRKWILARAEEITELWNERRCESAILALMDVRETKLGDALVVTALVASKLPPVAVDDSTLEIDLFADLLFSAVVNGVNRPKVEAGPIVP